jgi:transcriptional regulator with XRE-family HTH domain
MISMQAADLRLVGKVRSLAASGRARELRKSAEVSLREAAHVLGTSASTLSRWETGECRPRPTAALRWAGFLVELTGERL